MTDWKDRPQGRFWRTYERLYRLFIGRGLERNEREKDGMFAKEFPIGDDTKPRLDVTREEDDRDS